MITQARLFEICHYNPDTGIFTGLVDRGRRYKAGMPFGKSEKKGYLQVSIDGTTYQLHRLAWLYVFGFIPKDQIDHKNGITNDNRVENLRLASRYRNAQNKIYRVGKSGARGVREVAPGRWKAQVISEGKIVLRAIFDSFEEANKAAKAARDESHGEYQR